MAIISNDERQQQATFTITKFTIVPVNQYATSGKRIDIATSYRTDGRTLETKERLVYILVFYPATYLLLYVSVKHTQ